MASELRVNTLKDASGNNSVGMSYVAGGSAKAWAAYGNDAVIDDSLNGSSVTDNGTADFTFTITSATASTNTAVSGSVIGNTYGNYACMLTASGVAKTTTATRHRVVNFNDSLSYQDLGPMQPIIHGDLA